MASAPSPSGSPPRRSPWFSVIPWILSLGITAAGLRNALAPVPGLEAEARDVACTSLAPPSVSAKPAAAPRPSSCGFQMTRWEAGPLSRNFEFQVPPAPGTAPGTVRVQCRREHLAVGDYRCVVTP